MIEIVDSKIGVKTLKKDNLFLQSKYNPLLEAEKFVKKVLIDNNIIDDNNNLKNKNYFFILFGSGLGYIFDYLIKFSIESQQIFIYEPDYLLFEYLIKNKNINNNNIIDFNNERIIIEQFEKLIIEKKKPIIIGYDSYIKSFENKYEFFQNKIKDYINKSVENVKVTGYFSKIWFLNFIRNCLFYCIFDRFYYFSDKNIKLNFKVLIIASGPTLDYFLDEIKKLKDNFLIVSVLSASRTLLKNGIIPDYIILSDAGIANKLHFYEVDNNITVLSNIYANSSALFCIKNKVIFFNLLSELEKTSFKLDNPSVTIEAALLFSSIFGKENIFFVGFDLSYNILRGSHSSDNAIYNLRDYKFNKLYPKYNILSSFLLRNDITQLDYPFFTNSQYLLIRNYVDSYFKNSNYIGNGTKFSNLNNFDKLDDIKRSNLKNKIEIKNEFEKLFLRDFSIKEKCIKKIEEIKNIIQKDENLEILYYKDILFNLDRNIGKNYFVEKIDLNLENFMIL